MPVTKTVRVVHVDDDPAALQQVQALLADEPDVVYLGGFTSAEEALGCILEEEADLILIDVVMPGTDGLWLAGQLDELQPDIVFVTAYAGYAAQAFEVCALDYLLKPLSAAQLQVLLQRIRTRRLHEARTLREQVESIYQYLDPKKSANRIFIRTAGKIQVVQLTEVIYFTSNKNYTALTLKNGEQATSGKTIKVFETALKHHPDFLRISRSHIINKRMVAAIHREPRTRKIIISMSNNDRLETSYTSKEEALDYIR